MSCFENLDDVAVFQRLREALQGGAHPFRVAMHCYFWGRLSSFTISDGSIRSENDADLKSKAIAALRGNRGVKLSELSADAEAAALGVTAPPPKRLMTVGYWSNVCYTFRYLASSDPKWCAFSADSFLSALDDLDEKAKPRFLQCEMKNLSAGFSVAEAVPDTRLADDADRILSWSSSATLGDLLPEFGTGTARLK